MSLSGDELQAEIERLDAEVTALREQIRFLHREVEVREARIQDTMLQLQGQLFFEVTHDAV